jgi:hypothetical protein
MLVECWGYSMPDVVTVTKGDRMVEGGQPYGDKQYDARAVLASTSLTGQYNFKAAPETARRTRLLRMWI